jgi:hypothetical protein
MGKLTPKRAYKLVACAIVGLVVSVAFACAVRMFSINTPTSLFIGGGDGENYVLGNSTGDYLGAWNLLLDNLGQWHFNVMRLAFSFADSPVNSTTRMHDHTPIDYATMDNVIALLFSKGYRVILDCHNYEDMEGWFGSQAWSNDWFALATHYKGDHRILAYELFNEPSSLTWSSDVTSQADVAQAYANLTDRIRSIDLSRTMVWESQRYLGQSLPSDAVRDNIIFTWHAWMVNPLYANDLNGTINAALQEINEALQWQQQYPNSTQWFGEFGVEDVLNGVQFNATCQRAFDVTLINACIEHDWGFCFWVWNYEWIRGPALDFDSILEASNYAGTPDIAVTNVMLEETIVQEGFALQVNVTVANTGNSTESFNLTVYANTTSIGTQQVTLPGGNSTIIVSVWNTTGFALGNYTISAYAEPVPDEYDTASNTYVTGPVQIIPEFPTILPTFVIITLLAVALKKRKS